MRHIRFVPCPGIYWVSYKRPRGKRLKTVSVGGCASVIEASRKAAVYAAQHLRGYLEYGISVFKERQVRHEVWGCGYHHFEWRADAYVGDLNGIVREVIPA